jgi:hypothetical protein
MVQIIGFFLFPFQMLLDILFGTSTSISVVTRKKPIEKENSNP